MQVASDALKSPGRRRFLLLSVPLVVAGCGPKRPEVVPASGLVTFEGGPVAGAQVTFMAPSAARAAYAVTDDAGVFVLSTFGKADGAAPGTHVVTIAKTQPTGSDAPMAVEQADAAYTAAMAKAARRQGDRSEIPARYADPSQSGLTAEVKRGTENRFVFALEK
jgi:hypothetical protein